MTAILNLTAEEEYRLTGTVTGRRAEELLDASDKVKAYDGIQAYIQEAKGCFVKEDFLGGVTTDLTDLATSLRGDNRIKLLSLIEEIERYVTDAIRDGEYGASELQLALNSINSA